MRTCVYLHGDDETSISAKMNELLGDNREDVKVLRLDMVELDQARIASQSRSLFGHVQYRVGVRNVQSANPFQGKKLLQLIEEKRDTLVLVLCAPNVKYSKDLHKKLLRHPAVDVREFRPKRGYFFKQWFNDELRKRQLNLNSEAIAWVCQRLDGMQSNCCQLLDHLELYQLDKQHDISVSVVAALCGEERSEEIRSYCHAMLARSPDALVLLNQLMMHQHLVAIQVSTWLQNALQSMLIYKTLIHQMSVQQAARQAKIFTAEDKRVYANQHQHWSLSQLQGILYELAHLERFLKGHSIESDAVLMQQLTVKVLMQA
ncbi:MAG: hypothetical protein Q9M28_11770 [Mariprofundaceae bacterium]|nr:hypothetical protein [Mariprofundaceae bacterium]